MAKIKKDVAVIEEKKVIKPIKKYLPKTKEVLKPNVGNWFLEVPMPNENWAYFNNIFTAEECKKIIEIGTNEKLATPLEYGLVGELQNVEKNIEKLSEIRRSPISWLKSDIEDTHWIYRRITDVIKNINEQFFKFDLTEIQNLQFTCYDSEEKGFYGKHIDMMYRSTGTRKLSVTVQLSDPSKYEGGDLLLHTGDNPEKPMKKQGMGVFFPGYTLHEVTPVTKGKRYSLVAWVLGPKFK